MNELERIMITNALLYYNERVIKELPESIQKEDFQKLWKECWDIIAKL